ncbi:hypothetical protein G7Y41_05575 [Schaalia sp. ZJ405]|uniref:hypothetical protein n=1 Tax=Schaalia sp. ZJ405 TaxID=2709403 RepID=UPI0013EDB0A8|nr:hypothetical protein [Schaalia sp. ZJ405]QPK80578.1 hypothetical protein G7Y41_05575 [Schaalia sp. ZJ405]
MRHYVQVPVNAACLRVSGATRITTPAGAGMSVSDGLVLVTIEGCRPKGGGD